MTADLYIEVESNPNCEELPGMVYNALEAPRQVSKMRVRRGEAMELCWVAGVEPSGFGPAQVQKITDSGAGVAYCIYGGRWGLRFQLATSATPQWNLSAADQWGEPCKIYGDLDDVVLSD